MEDRLTVPSYWFAVPSKHKTKVRGDGELVSILDLRGSAADGLEDPGGATEPAAGAEEDSATESMVGTARDVYNQITGVEWVAM